jgi:hypothetical protein
MGISSARTIVGGDKRAYSRAEMPFCEKRVRGMFLLSLFPHEFGWVDGNRSTGWNGGRGDA